MEELENQMSLQKSLPGIFGIILAFGLSAFAQEPQSPTAPTPDSTLRRQKIEQRDRHVKRTGRHEGFGRRGPGMGRFMHELNLSEEQRQQMRAITERRLESTKTQREELIKLREKRIAGAFTAEDEARAAALHQEIRTAMEGVRTEMNGILTAEQKAHLEELKNEHKARREQRLKERLDKNPQ